MYIVADKDGVIETAEHVLTTRRIGAGNVEVDVYEDAEGRYWRKDSKEIIVTEKPE